MLQSSVNYKKLLFLTLLGAFLYFVMPIPIQLEVKAWYLLLVFIMTIVGAIISPLPMEGVALISLSVILLTEIVPTKVAMSGFSSSIVWLVLVAFIIARAIINTGLANRIAYFFIKTLGKSSIGLGYSVIFTELCLAPLMPSASARGGGVIFPIATTIVDKYSNNSNKNLSGDLNNREADSSSAINNDGGGDHMNNDHQDNLNALSSVQSSSQFGTFLMQLCLQVNVITSAMFLTAMAGNPLVIKFAAAHDINITWGDWAKGALVPGLLNLMLLPFLLAWICKIKNKSGDLAVSIAKKSLKEMGGFKVNEAIMVVIFVILITLWLLESVLHFSSSSVAIFGLVLLVLTKVLSVEDILKEKKAWGTLIWFGVLIMIAENLNNTGVTKWISNYIGLWINTVDVPISVAIIIAGLMMFFIHYFFASITTHVAVMYPLFLGTFLMHFQTPPMATALGLSFISIISGGLTHFGSSAAPVFFGAGYATTSRWWKISFVISVINLLIWVLTSYFWFKFLGWL